MVAITARPVNFLSGLKKIVQRPATVEVEVVGPRPTITKWPLEKAEAELPITARYSKAGFMGRITLVYCVFETIEEVLAAECNPTDNTFVKYRPVPIDRKRQNLDNSPAEYLEKVHPNTVQTFFIEKQHTRRKKFAHKGSALQKVQAGLYVALAGGLAFLLFIIFAEVTGI